MMLFLFARATEKLFFLPGKEIGAPNDVFLLPWWAKCLSMGWDWELLLRGEDEEGMEN